ncbi:hypothetical protein LY78DRAFT_683923 [Colletotrichum sublineola]|uniref:Uncharacterized protein n=1 Tax=Colletotrichum sublineola TaxID=1173701 RepID=A0A066XVL4_COLSU|nr:hypothetical protein LY78DRAFT_683923 [Colletotrichum sublineola]KDN71709.1 hypothetical protein CSUB01_10687 [Colletotrichum sublineola]
MDFAKLETFSEEEAEAVLRSLPLSDDSLVQAARVSPRLHGIVVAILSSEDYWNPKLSGPEALSFETTVDVCAPKVEDEEDKDEDAPLRRRCLETMDCAEVIVAVPCSVGQFVREHVEVEGSDGPRALSLYRL